MNGQEHGKILEQAMALGKERYSNAPGKCHAAFANSVAYIMTGMAGGFGGPSMREHWAGRVAHSKGLVGNCSFEQAVEVAEGVCFGPLSYEIALMLEVEYCFDDAPNEQEEARQLLAERG